LPVASAAGQATDGPTSQRPPSVLLDASSLPRSAWFEAWRAYNAGLYEIAPSGSSSLVTEPSASAWRVGTIVAGTTICPTLSFRRERPLIRQSDDHLLFRFYRIGGLSALLDGEPLRIRPGAFHLFDPMRPFNGVSDASVNCSVTIPYASIGYEPTRHRAHFSLGDDTPAGRMLAAALETLYDQAPLVSADDGGLLADGFVAHNRAAAIRRYVEAHFADPAISAESVASAIGASRATVYRVFAREHGFERALIRRRLRAAATELSQTPPHGGAIVTIAARWGFHDPGWFARLCREHFGCAPSDLLGLVVVADRPFARQHPSPAAGATVPQLKSLYA
jgi:AraC-like DNA-binding protein